MTITKYTTFEQAAKDLWVLKPDKKYYKQLKSLFKFWGKIYKPKILRGIQKFKQYQ